MINIYPQLKVIDVLKNYWRNDILHQTERNETGTIIQNDLVTL